MQGTGYSPCNRLQCQMNRCNCVGMRSADIAHCEEEKSVLCAYLCFWGRFDLSDASLWRYESYSLIISAV